MVSDAQPHEQAIGLSPTALLKGPDLEAREWMLLLTGLDELPGKFSRELHNKLMAHLRAQQPMAPPADTSASRPAPNGEDHDMGASANGQH